MILVETIHNYAKFGGRGKFKGWLLHAKRSKKPIK